MAGFDTLGSTFNTNVGGSFNPALGSAGGASGQSGPAGYGIQPPRISSPYSVDSLGLSAGNRPSQSDLYNQSAQVYTPGPDTSPQHEANVAMAQSGLGNLGMQGYRGFPNEVQGTSNSNYGIAPQGWSDINAYMANPLGQWQTPVGATMGQYGDVGTDTNSSRFQMMMDSIKSSLSGQWPNMDWTKQFPGAGGLTQDANGNYVSPVQGAWPGLNSLGSDYGNASVADLLLRFGSGYGALPPAVTQNVGIPTPSIPNTRTYS